MARRPHGGKGRTPAGRGKRHGAAPPRPAIGVRKLPDGRGWALVPPRGAAERVDDLDEVRGMLEAGEVEVAIDELRWLLSGCPELIEAHAMLGEIAASTSADIELARGHFGYAYELGESALRSAGCAGPLPGDRPENAPWHAAACGLAWCLEKLGQPSRADEVASYALSLDPTDPAGVRGVLDDLRSGGLPIVELRPPGR